MKGRRVGLAVAFARSWLSWFVDGTPRPLSAGFAITYRCNLRCSYCNTPNLERDHLTPAQVDIVLDRLAAAGVRRIGYAGGEPLLRRDIGQIVARTAERGFFVTMNTNLTLYRDCRDVFDRIDLVFTSVDGDRQAHVANRGAGSYDGVLDAIDDLVGAGKPVVAIAVITGQNIDQLDRLLDLADRHRFRVHLQPHTVGGVCMRGTRSDEVTNRRERAFWAAALERRRAGRPLASSSAYLETLSHWDDFGVAALLEPGTRCAAGRGFVYVDSRGVAWPCAFLKDRVSGVDLLSRDWRDGFDRALPCSRCSVGPHLEFNVLYQQPVRSALELARTYT